MRLESLTKVVRFSLPLALLIVTRRAKTGTGLASEASRAGCPEGSGQTLLAAHAVTIAVKMWGIAGIAFANGGSSGSSRRATIAIVCRRGGDALGR